MEGRTGNASYVLHIMGLVDTAGAPRRVYPDAADNVNKWDAVMAMNAKLDSLGPVLATLTWQGAKSWIMDPDSTRGWSGWGLVTNVTTKTLSGSSDAVAFVEMGHLTSPGNDYFIVANRRTETSGTRNVRLYLNAKKLVTNIYTKMQWLVAEDGRFVDEIGPGDAMLYKAETRDASLVAKVNVLLQGPYNGSGMSTSLRDAALLPTSQPYNTAPWNYTISESVTSIPAGVVDWVLVELRTGIAPGTKAATRAAFIKSDGTIVDVNGTGPVEFSCIADFYYIVVRHRNHIAVMSKDAIAFTTESVAQYDFTTAQEKAYGDTPMEQLATGVYGMYAGDADASGAVGASDRTDAWNQRNQNGYKSADLGPQRPSWCFRQNDLLEQPEQVNAGTQLATHNSTHSPAE